MPLLTSDFEVTTWNNGNPFDQRNFAVCLAWKIDNQPTKVTDLFNPFEEHPYPFGYQCIFFNAKFDLHWYRNLGIKLPTKIHCCQLAEYYLSGFTNKYPSLEDTSAKYNLGYKIDVIKEKYWDKGINTHEIPKEELHPYAAQDVELTYQIYLKQIEQFQTNPRLYKSFLIACEDLLVLEEMESNGILYDEELCLNRAEQLTQELQQIQSNLSSVYPDVPINFASPDQLSSFLYGGEIKEERREQIGLYKTGSRQGQPRYSVKEIVHQLPRLVNPLPRSEMAKEGKFATDEGTLRKLKGPAAKKYVSILLKHAELEKLVGTYYNGIPKLNKLMHWPSGMIHGQFNQVVAQTSRLSSSKP